MSTFPCTACGCCCKRIKHAVNYFNIREESHPLFFPYKWDKNGICENFTEDNKCKVYENRPLLCNIEKFAEFYNLNKDEFFKRNVKACNKMMDKDGIPLSFRIK